MMDDFFDNDFIPEDFKKDLSFSTTILFRDVLNIATSSENDKTYEDALAIINDLSPDLYAEFIKRLTEKNESEIVKEYKEKAGLLTIKNNREISASQLLKLDISGLEDLLNSPNLSEIQTKWTKRRIIILKGALNNLIPIRVTEQKVLVHDYGLDARFGKYDSIETSYKYKDYKVDDNNYLRLRLLHPDEPEHITGADLLYEQHDVDNDLVRFIFLQYKIWENKSISLSPNGRNYQQIMRLKNSICDTKKCLCTNRESKNEFRFPYCSAFYRPTDKLQANKKMISSGIHIPICKILEMTSINHILKKVEAKKNSINHNLFENLFNNKLIGSDWMPYNEVELFFKETKILAPEESILIFASQFKTTFQNNESPNITDQFDNNDDLPF